jgi:hypothetical protein
MPLPAGSRGCPSGQTLAAPGTLDRHTAQRRLVIIDLEGDSALQSAELNADCKSVRRSSPVVAAGGLEPPTQRL